MFTGLIQNIGTLNSLSRRGSEATLSITTGLRDFELGESIAVMGACLSVTSFDNNSFSAFASRETLDKTGLGHLGPGARINLERAAKFGDAVGGHLVSGHVDARVKVLGRKKVEQAEVFTIAMPEGSLAKQIAPKGSVTIDGVSLTVNEVRADGFDVMVIPITLEHTTLGWTNPGDSINMETDVLAKYVARQLEQSGNNSSGIDMDLLTRSGFVR